MAGRSPFFSSKHVEREIGYIEGDRAFDLFDRPRATYDGDTGLPRDPNTLAILGYITLKGTFVGSFRIAEELFAESGSVPLRERRDNDLAYPDAEAPAEIMQRAGLNEEYDASSVDGSRSNFERFVSARPGRLDHPEMFAEARDRPASQERSEQQSKCECVLGANESPSLNDPFQGHTEPFDGSSQGNTQRSNGASSHGDIEPPNEASSQGDTEPLNNALSQGDAEPSSAADTQPLSDLSLLVEREPFNGPLERQPSLHDAPELNGRTLKSDREAADEPCLQAEPEPLKPSFQQASKLANEPSLPAERERLSEPLLEDESDIVVAPPAPSMLLLKPQSPSRVS